MRWCQTLGQKAGLIADLTIPPRDWCVCAVPAMTVGECDAKGYDLRTRRQSLRSSRDPDVKRLEGSHFRRGYAIAQMSHILCSPERWQRAETILGTPSGCLNSALRRSKHPWSSRSRPNVPCPDAPKRRARDSRGSRTLARIAWSILRNEKTFDLNRHEVMA